MCYLLDQKATLFPKRRQNLASVPVIVTTVKGYRRIRFTSSVLYVIYIFVYFCGYVCV